MLSKCFIICILALYASLVCSENRADDIRRRIELLDRSSVLVVAHRGDWRSAPENSMMGIEHAIKLGVDIIEIDIQRTKDGHLVLMHDETLDRTTTGKGRVDSITLNLLKELNLLDELGVKTKEVVPTLEEALLNSKGRVILNLDKADRYIDEVYDLLKKTGMQQYVIMKTNKSFVDTRVQFHDYLLTGFLMPIINLDTSYAESEIDAYLNFLRPKMIEFVFSDNANPILLTLKDRLQEKTLIWYNTMWDTLSGGYDDDMALRDPDAVYGYLIELLGANIIQTDRPEYLLQYLRERNLHK